MNTAISTRRVISAKVRYVQQLMVSLFTLGQGHHNPEARVEIAPLRMKPSAQKIKPMAFSGGARTTKAPTVAI